MDIKVVLDNGAYMPEKAHTVDAGFDIRTPVTAWIGDCDSLIIDTGVHIEIPKGYVGFLKSKSGLNVKYDLVGEGVIDCGYTGSITVKLYNNGVKPYRFSRGDKIIQLVILPIPEVNLIQVDKLEDTERGNTRDMIDGSLNRIMVTDDKEELLTMIASVNYRMSLLAKDTMRRIDEQTYKDGIE